MFYTKGEEMGTDNPSEEDNMSKEDAEKDGTSEGAGDDTNDESAEMNSEE